MAQVSSILDASGQPMRPAARAAMIRDTAHEGASRFSAELGGWDAPLLSADAAYIFERDTLVARIEDLIRNNGWVSGAVRKQLDATIGAGLRLKSKPNWRMLQQLFPGARDVGPEWAAEWSRQVEAAFRAYAYDPRNLIDAKRQTNFAGLLGAAMRQRMVTGDTLCLPRWRARPGARYRTCFDLIDPTRLANPMGEADGDRYRAGIEIDDIGAAVAGHIRKAHPGDIASSRTFAYETERVPMFMTWGRPALIHHFEIEGDNQHRGKSLLTAILKRERMAARYDDLEMQAATVNAGIVGSIESPLDQGFVADMLNEGDDDGVKQLAAERAGFYEVAPIKIDGARFLHPYPGDRVNLMQSTRPNSGHGPFLELAHRHLATAIGLSPPQVSGNYAGINYSTMRAAFIDVHRFVDCRRFFFAAGVATKMFMCWLEEAIDLGYVQLPAGLPDFGSHAFYADVFPLLCACDWIGPGRGYIDPTKEAQAALMRIDGQLSTATREAELQGMDFEDVVAEQAEEKALRERYGVPDPNWAMLQQRGGAEHASDRESREPQR